MKYYSVAYPDEDGNDVVETLSEQDILDEYWEYWSSRMIKKYGQEYFDTTFSVKECIEDWIVVHWAWESDDAGTEIKAE